MTQRVLHLAKDLSLPLDAVTQTIAILAKRRAGKSYTMRRLVEQLFKAGQQVVIVDPKGDQWGVRSAADGKSPGLPIVILGGERGDVPLEPSGGEVVAKLVVEDRVSVLLDISLFRKHEVSHFMTDFLENLYRLKAREVYRTPMMLVVDEADAIAPQKPQKGEERMLGAAEDIVRRGGQRGIGCVLVTQRSAVLNKNVLTQAQMLVALRTIAPQDLDAMNAWVEVHGTREQQKTLMESLPALPVGDAWFWSPGWPTTDGIFKRVHVLPIETFDSGATPKPGAKPIEPKHAADVDLDALKRQMAATIEKAKADDPRELRRQIAELKKQIVSAPKQIVSSAPKIVEKFVLKDGQLARAEKLVERAIAAIIGFHDRLQQTVEAAELKTDKPLTDLRAIVDSITAAIEKTRAPLSHIPQAPMKRREEPLQPQGRREPTGRAVPGAAAVRPTRGNFDRSLGRGQHKVLIAIAQHADGVTREQLTILTGYKRSSRDTYLQQLQQHGLVTTNGGGTLVATADGVALLGSDFEPLPTGDELRAYWLDRLPLGEKALLEVLVNAYPKAVDRDALGDTTGYKRSSRDTYLQKLSARKLVTADRDGIRASNELFS